MKLIEWLQMGTEVSYRERLDGLAELQDQHRVHQTDTQTIQSVLALVDKLAKDSN